ALADGQVVAVIEGGVLDGAVVDARTVGGAQVAHVAGVALAPHLAVLARNADVWDLQVGVVRPPDHDRLFRDVDTLAQPLPVNHHQAHGALLGLFRAGADDRPASGAGFVAASVHGHPLAGASIAQPLPVWVGLTSP